MELIVSQCKECGYKAHSFTALDKNLPCPKCGKKALEQTGKTSIDFNPQFTVPATLDKKAFLTFALDQMKKCNVPIELYRNINPDRIVKFQIPAFGFIGTVDAKWQCEYNGNMEISINNKKTNITPGAPMSGEVSGYNFGAFIPGAKSEPNDGNDWTKNFTSSTPISKSVNIDNSVVTEPNTFTLLPSTEPLMVWSEKGQNLCDDIAKQQAEIQTSNSIGLYEALGLMSKTEAAGFGRMMGSMGKEVPPTRNWKVFSRSNLSQNPINALIPVWYLPIEFNGKPCFFAVTADESCSGSYSLPTVSSTGNEPENEEIQEAKKKAKYVKLGGLLAIPLFFIANFITTLIFLVVWFGVYMYFDKQVSNLKSAENKKASDEVNEEIRKVMSKLK